MAVAAVLLAIFALDVAPWTAIAGFLLFGALALVAVAVASYVFARRWAQPLESLEEGLWQISVGDFERRIPTESRDLIVDLAESLEKTQDYLKQRFADMQAGLDQLGTVLNSMLEGVVAVGPDQRILLLNDSACRLFRIDREVAIGRPVFELIRNHQLQKWVAEALGQSEPVGGELELLVPVTRVLAVRVAGLTGSTGGAIVVASDVSQLRRLERVRQEFVANASHELKTPLASIKACVETLLDGALDDPEMRIRFLQTVNEQTERLDKLVRDLLSLTRIESEGPKTDLRPVALTGIVDVIVDRHCQYAERKQMRLLVEPPAEPLYVLADEEALEQILDNLVDNAFKYTNDGGTVTIRWSAAEGACALDVEDTGIGIPQSHLTRIFERFYRVDRARSRELGGTGLGLAIVKHLVQALGGAVTVSSRLGKGTTFSVRIPLAIPSEFSVSSSTAV